MIRLAVREAHIRTFEVRSISIGATWANAGSWSRTYPLRLIHQLRLPTDPCARTFGHERRWYETLVLEKMVFVEMECIYMTRDRELVYVNMKTAIEDTVFSFELTTSGSRQ
jgi:hypothetical protein